MQKDLIRTAAIVTVTAGAGLAVYEWVWGYSRGAAGLHWRPVLEGVLIGLSAALALLAARTRLAAAGGLVVAGVFILGGTAGLLPLATIQTPFLWAVGAGLLVRLLVPGEPQAHQRGRDGEAVTQ